MSGFRIVGTVDSLWYCFLTVMRRIKDTTVETWDGKPDHYNYIFFPIVDNYTSQITGNCYTGCHTG